MVNKKQRVLVGMSGGVDSTATCLMLQESGYEVIGLTMWVYGEKPLDAVNLAASMNIEHYIVDEREQFKNSIVKYFIDEYKQGRTPNPCVMCNPQFKFRILLEWADKLNCPFIATGHYSQLEQRNEHTYIIVGRDERKDQSYFLWRLSQDILKRTLFPLGTFTKPEVREYLLNKGYQAKSEEGESMEVCFIKGDYRDFLKEHSPEIDQEIGPGWFVDSKGIKLGQHKGIAYYTIGQRKGLEIALGQPMYVTRLNPLKNTVMLGDKSQLQADYMLAEDALFVNKEELFAAAHLTVRIRYRSQPIPCQVKEHNDGRLVVKFLTPASAITPGQSAVFYDGPRLLGGAFIGSQRQLKWVLSQINEQYEF